MTILLLIQHNIVKVSASASQAICLGALGNLIKIRSEKVCLQSGEKVVQHTLYENTDTDTYMHIHY